MKNDSPAAVEKSREYGGLSKNAYNERIKYRSTFLNGIGLIVLAAGLFAPAMALTNSHVQEISLKETFQIVCEFIFTNPGIAAISSAIGSMVFHKLAIRDLRALKD